MKKRDVMALLHKYGKQGVELLSEETPYDSGETADSWDYEISAKDGQYNIYWTNSNVNDGVHIAILLQYDHATGTGGFVEGIDYINPALKQVFEEMASELWKGVVNA